MLHKRLYVYIQKLIKKVDEYKAAYPKILRDGNWDQAVGYNSGIVDTLNQVAAELQDILETPNATTRRAMRDGGRGIGLTETTLEELEKFINEGIEEK